MTTIYDFNVKKPNGDTISLKDYEGKVVLIVNTASKCGLTPQFQGLQELYTNHHEKGFVVLGFPCDQFNNQEFDNIEETTEFCQLNYGVSFPMFAKIKVNGDDADPLFKYLKEEKRGLLMRKIEWNFAKFLIDAQGKVVKRYAATTDPSKLEGDIVALLK
ncbi:glutathione peroxidase [Paenibacillus endoradicis]|uniref:glutathione peroxidase n=1 Tax=Paenibacillus endoradicis TaxID=2972487 RepID=UPI0021599566|nr:glutathione peroxidase [Paenibacillus endoradicis]MCR8659944.1 glutathione peroxidase [Paenibacillus endoradicis]